MKIQEIETIVKLMSDNDLTEFKIEAEDYNICIKRGAETKVVSAPSMSVMPQVAQMSMPTAPQTDVPSTEASAAPAAGTGKQQTIDSPIVGTFYSAPSPEAANFVNVGDRVTADTVVCIVEAMKVMNEIKAEKSGVIKEVLVENANPVEFGQPLFVIEED